MSMTLILPWLPIVLSVAVGSRLMDKARGLGLGVLGALFWLALVQATAGPGVFADSRLLASLALGAIAIVAVGVWSGHVASSSSPEQRQNRSPSGGAVANKNSRYAPVAETLLRYDDWLEAYRHAPDPWPEFGEFLRSSLYDLCGATHVRPYRVLSEGDCLLPLRELQPGDTSDIMPARQGILGHVVTSGVSFVAGDQSHGKLVDDLANESDEDIAWCFAVKQGGRRIGVVRVGILPAESLGDQRLLDMAERLACHFWTLLAQACRTRAAETIDPASGLLVREAFLQEAERALAASEGQSEPAAVAVITLEGIRALADCGNWERADGLITAVARLLRECLRSDDCLGRFDDSRFIILLRRVDSALATLIVNQLVGKLTALCKQEMAANEGTDYASSLNVRCGISGTGTEHPTLVTLVSRAIAQCHEARRSVVPVASDLEAGNTPATSEDEASLERSGAQTA